MYRTKLLELGIGANLKGFELLNYAIGIYNPPQKITRLYMDVANKFDTTAGQAERAMRHAISKTKEQGITVGQFIAKYRILWGELNGR